MNEIFAIPLQRSTTQAAEGLPRWRWTVAEIEKMAAAGIFHESDQFELVGGEIVPMMSPASRGHETVRIKLARRLHQLAPANVMVASEPQFNLAPDTYLKPDILVHPDAINTYDLKGTEAWLVIEVAETSFSYDLKSKRPIYAVHGVREYWVISAATLKTTVHRKPSGNSYEDVQEISPDVRLVPLLAPELAVSLSELDLA